MLEKTKPRRMTSSSDETEEFSVAEAKLLSDIPLLSGNDAIDLNMAIQGYVNTMKKKSDNVRKVIKRIDRYINQLERTYKTVLNVSEMNYDLTDSENEFGGDSPPHRKIARLTELATIESPSDEAPTAIEGYFNGLETKMKKLILHTDNEGFTLAPNNRYRKAILREFLIRSNLISSEILPFIKAEAGNRNPPNVDPAIAPLQAENPSNYAVDPPN